MKLQIIANESQKIEGFETVWSKKDAELSLDDIPDNSCELILAKNTVDENVDRIKCLKSIASKVRMRGTVSVSGTDVLCLCKATICSTINTETCSSIMSNLNSIGTISDVKAALRSMGFTVVSSSIHGVNYEVTAKRV